MHFRLLRALIVAVPLSLAACNDYGLENRPAILFSGRGGERVHVTPYPMSRPAADIWKSDACWRACEARCAAEFDNCAAGGAQACRSELDRCSRACVADCRLSGGPLLRGIE